MALFKPAQNLPPPDVLKGISNVTEAVSGIVAPETVGNEPQSQKNKNLINSSQTIIFLCSVIILLIVVIFFMGLKLTNTSAMVEIPTIEASPDTNSISPYKF